MNISPIDYLRQLSQRAPELPAGHVFLDQKYDGVRNETAFENGLGTIGLSAGAKVGMLSSSHSMFSTKTDYTVRFTGEQSKVAQALEAVNALYERAH